jgi:uncharacterized protein YecE (DUF72 family)
MTSRAASPGMPVLIGTSGLQYEDWRHRFYLGVPQRYWFEHTMTWFRTLELNVSFYRLPRREVFAGWRERSPDDAVIAVKASRFLTHVRRLRDPAEPVARLMSRAVALGSKLGPVLIQLPPDLTVDAPALAATIDSFPAGTRVAFEPRHESWWSPEVRDLLSDRGVALVWADRAGSPYGPLWRTAAWGYVRMHHGDAQVPPNYHRHTLGAWAARIAATYGDDEDVFVYFNNDGRCAAVDNAVTFAEEVRGIARTATRTPGIRPDSWS